MALSGSKITKKSTPINNPYLRKLLKNTLQPNEGVSQGRRDIGNNSSNSRKAKGEPQCDGEGGICMTRAKKPVQTEAD